jgi:hypothetical protein
VARLRLEPGRGQAKMVLYVAPSTPGTQACGGVLMAKLIHSAIASVDGYTAWSLTTVPNQGGGGQLAAVTASSPTSVWAAGAADGTSVLHWNGTSWTPETIPSGPDGPRIMTGISAVRGSATEVWGAAGTFVVHHP